VQIRLVEYLLRVVEYITVEVERNDGGSCRANCCLLYCLIGVWCSRNRRGHVPVSEGAFKKALRISEINTEIDPPSNETGMGQTVP